MAAWMVLLTGVLSQAPIVAMPDGGFATEGFARSAAHRRRVLEVVLPTDSSSGFVFTDSGRKESSLEITLAGERGQGFLEPSGDAVTWPDRTTNGFTVKATATRASFAFAGRQVLEFRSTAQQRVQGSAALFTLVDGSAYRVTPEGPANWNGSRLEVLAPSTVRVELLVTRGETTLVEVPIAAWGASMAWDEARQRLIRIGGTDAPLSTIDLTPDLRTWTWDEHAGWRTLPFSGPGERVRSAMVWDRAREVLVVFGGSSAQGMLDDTWELTATGWRRAPNAVSPSPRWSHGMAFDPVMKRVLLFGGLSGSSTGTEYGDTWEFTTQGWFQLSPAGSPGGRDAHGMIWHDGLEAPMVFGGWNGGSILGDSWVMQGGSWTALSPVASPPPRTSLSMAWDPLRQAAVISGGWEPRSNLVFADTWSFDGTNWAQLPAAPRPWFRAALASHPRFGVVAYGGLNTSGAAMSATMYLSDAGWQPLPIRPLTGRFFQARGEEGFGMVEDGSLWTVDSQGSRRVRNSAVDVTAVAVTPKGLVAVSPNVTWFDPLDGGPGHPLTAGGPPPAAHLVWDEGLQTLWLVTPAGELHGLLDGGWVRQSLLRSPPVAMTGAEDGGLLVVDAELHHYDPLNAALVRLGPAPPGAGRATLTFDLRREVLVAERGGALWELEGESWVGVGSAFDVLELLGADGENVVGRWGDGDDSFELQQLRGLGARCGEAIQCASQLCVDGRCCASECAGGVTDCMACSMEAGGEADGRCTTIRAGFELICASEPPCLRARCLRGHAVCPPLDDYDCPFDAGPPQPLPPRRDAGPPPVLEEPPVEGGGCGCAGGPGTFAAWAFLLLCLPKRRLRSVTIFCDDEARLVSEAHDGLDALPR